MERIKLHDLVQRNGLYYRKFTDVPFTGPATDENEFGLWSDGSLENGLKEGPWTRYYDEGQLWEKFIYQGGLIQYHESWHENGQLMETCEYKNDKLHGHHIQYFDNGQIKFKGMCEEGRCVGEWVYYYYNGQILKKTDYETGITITYDEDGEQITQI